MKKYLFLAAVAVMAITSCTTTTKTAKTTDMPADVLSATVADLEVSPNRISYTMTPSKEVQRAGLGNVKRAAIMEALQANDKNADILVEPEFVISMKNNFFTKKVTSVTVTGRPAKYKGYRSLGDDVWCNSVFRGTYKNKVQK